MPTRMYWFAVPALILFVVFWVYPVFQMFYYSITNFNGVNYDYDFVGVRNFQSIVKDGSLVNGIKNTFIYTIIIVVISNVVGLALALLLNLKLKGKSIFRTLVYLPALFSPIVVGFIWSYVYMPGSGMLSSIIELFGMDGTKLNLLGDFGKALYAITAVDIWKNVGTTMIIYLAGLQTIDDSLLEAGKIDGCNEWKLITKVKLPLISATITINVVLNVIAGLKAFDYSFIMTNGGPGKSTQTLMYIIFNTAFNKQLMGKASALSVVSFIIIIAITILMLRFMNKREVEF
ncbi:sugar ABC transporter permease [Agathobacter ruminis]|uniref:Sugar ABC transporter permease n=2 Tax=Agathobacter ruminis TaxID=1712665 RepID=A0A2G3E1U8_9FIRM|nr:sugar ABC transporter permease [Agathobacter ruminis]